MLISGSDLMCFVAKPSEATDASAGQKAARSIGAATNHTLSINHSTKEITHKDKGSGRFQYTDFGRIDWSITAEGFIIDTQSFTGESGKTSTADNKREGHGMFDIYDMLMNREPVYIMFALETDSKDYRQQKMEQPNAGGWKFDSTTGAALGGYAWVTNITENAPVGEYSTYTVEFQGNGPLEKIAASSASLYTLDTPVVAKTSKTTTAEK